MSKNGNKAVDPTPEKVKAAEEEPKFTLDKLRENSYQLFGVSECTFVGATTELAESDLYSVKEIKTVIKEWQKKEVK